MKTTRETTTISMRDRDVTIIGDVTHPTVFSGSPYQAADHVDDVLAFDDETGERIELTDAETEAAAGELFASFFFRTLREVAS